MNVLFPRCKRWNSSYEIPMGVRGVRPDGLRFGLRRSEESADAVTGDLDRASRAVFACLLALPGEVVEKDKLLEAGWPDRLVHENSLAKAISRLRRTLDDGWRIDVVYGQGYRLVIDDSNVVPPQLPSVLPGRPGRHRLIGLAIAIVVGLLLVASIVYVAQKDNTLKIGEAPDAMGRVLWVDDHPENNVQEKQFIERQRMAVYIVTSSDEALKLLAMYRYDAVISDMGRNGNPLAGLELLEAMRQRGDHTPFYLYTILPSQAQRAMLAEYGGQGIAATPEGLYSLILPEVEREATAQTNP